MTLDFYTKERKQWSQSPQHFSHLNHRNCRFSRLFIITHLLLRTTCNLKVLEPDTFWRLHLSCFHCSFLPSTIALQHKYHFVQATIDAIEWMTITLMNTFIPLDSGTVTMTAHDDQPHQATTVLSIRNRDIDNTNVSQNDHYDNPYGRKCMSFVRMQRFSISFPPKPHSIALRSDHQCVYVHLNKCISSYWHQRLRAA